MSVKKSPQEILQSLKKDDTISSDIFTPILTEVFVDQLIWHEKFGKGKVISIYGSGENARVTVKFKSETKKLILSLAKLKGFKS